MPRDRGRSTLLRDRGKYDLAIIDSTDFSLGGAWSPGVHRQLKSLLREVGDRSRSEREGREHGGRRR